ncbi:MAG TPA: metallophosphoesterase family protein [Abditibacteriaceae bacterium]
MKLAIISDIHSNLPALEAVMDDLKIQSPDVVVVAGDFINRGPQPAEVWSLLQSTGWTLLRGNHEDYIIAQCAPLEPDDPLSTPLWQPARWTAEQVGKRGDELQALPLCLSLDAPDGGKISVVHGTAQRNNEGIFPTTPDEYMAELIGDTSLSLFCCGHTHQSLIRKFGCTLVVNAGAVGLPFNGDPRAQYAIATWHDGAWQAELRAVEYDRGRTRAAFDSNRFAPDAGPLWRIIAHELETARPHLGQWVAQYAEAVRSGTLTIEDAVNRYFGD